MAAGSGASGLERFVRAQDDGGTYDRALAELRRGRKQGHWMWFVFPQITGLGSSPTARLYAIASLDEAREYVAHPVLGPRLHECCTALTRLPTDDPVEVLGGIDAMKLRSSVTLFDRAGDDPVHREVLDKFFAGEDDPATLQRI